MTKNTKENKHFPGIGCVCGAWSDYDCGCAGADWTSTEVYDLRDELTHIKELVNELLGIFEEVEESDEGIPFHPNTIKTCRVETNMRLLKLLPELKTLCKDDIGNEN